MFKKEDTSYELDISRHRPICGLFPAECQSFRETFQRFRLYYLRNIFTTFAVGLSGQELNSKTARKFFIFAVDFWVLSCQDKGMKNTAEHVIMKKIFIYRQACINKVFVHSGSIGII